MIKVLPNFDRFYSILATIQHFKRWKAAIMDQFVTFRKRVYRLQLQTKALGGKKCPFTSSPGIFGKSHCRIS